jgi:hypothetical protein
MGAEKGKRLLTMRALCERYSVVDRTIDRWLAAGILPQPSAIIQHRRYWDEADLVSRERDLARKAGEATT